MPSRILLCGIADPAQTELRRLARRVLGEVPIDEVATLDELTQQAARDRQQLLVLAEPVAGQSVLDYLRRLRHEAVFAPALVLLASAALRRDFRLDGAGAVDLLPAEGFTGFDFVRALVHLQAFMAHENRGIELENRLVESEEVRMQSLRRVQELSHQLALFEVDDELTGLRNERSVLKSLEEAVGLARRYGTPLSCLRIAIDEFGTIRMRFGASFADFVFVQVAHRLKRSVRSSDVLARYGQDEFLLFCPMTSSPEALQLAQRLRQAVAEHPLERERRSLRATLSAGIAAYEAPMTGATDLVQRAGEALEKARNRGGQQIETGS